MTIVPPIKSQGIKTKLASWIRDCSNHADYDRWVEPFAGTGVVAFNIQPKSALLCDSNPHLVTFYKAVQDKYISGERARSYLTKEGQKLLESEGDHYYFIRDKFNQYGDPLDFLFLSRSCFNGMMRFNKSGGFNVPFCKKPRRYAKSLITKICNQIDAVSFIIERGDYTFKNQDFPKTLNEAGDKDIIYCDPPYIGRHVDYFDSWSENDELQLKSLLEASGANFILSTWLQNKYRRNERVFSTWKNCAIMAKEHFYHVGASETNRSAMTEALLTNFSTPQSLLVENFDISESALLKNSLKNKKTTIKEQTLKNKTCHNLFTEDELAACKKRLGNLK